MTCIHYGNTSTQGWITAFLQNLYREDLFYADKIFSVWSMNKESNSAYNKAGFEKFSERFIRLYPGYMLDATMHIRAKPGTAVVNLAELTALFKSKD